MKVLAIAVAAATLFASVAVHGEESAAPLRLTLADAIERGVAASHRLGEATARHDAAEAVVGERHAATRPQVTTLAGYMRTNHVDEFGILLPNNQLRVIYPDVPDNYRARLDLAWPLYTGGRLDALIEAARKESAATVGDIDAVRADLRFEIARAFWGLVVADESLRVVTESLARTGVHVRDVKNQLAAGLVPPNEVLSAQAQESRQRMLSIQARSDRDVAEAGLARLIGAAPGTTIEPDAVLAPASDTANVNVLVGQAVEQRGDRRAMVDRRSAAELRQKAAAAGRRPTMAIGGGMDYARPNPRIFPRQASWKESWDASVSLSWPLFDGGRTDAEVAEAAAAGRAVQERLDELDSVVALEVRQRRSEVESSRAVIAAADAALLAATEARRVVGDRFSAGVATSTDVLDAQGAVLQAALDRTQAMANARLAEARLQRSLGR